MGLLEEGRLQQYRNDHVNANLSAEVKIIDGLKLRGVLVPISSPITAIRGRARSDVLQYRRCAETSAKAVRPTQRQASRRLEQTRYLINSQLMLDFDRTFGKHHVAALLGASNESYTSEANQISFKWADPDLVSTATAPRLSFRATAGLR